MSKMQPIPNKYGKFCGLCLPWESKLVKETSQLKKEVSQPTSLIGDVLKIPYSIYLKDILKIS